MSNSFGRQLHNPFPVISGAPVKQSLLGNCMDPAYPSIPVTKKMQLQNSRPGKSAIVVAQSLAGGLTLCTVADFVRDTRHFPCENCIDFALVSRYCIVLHTQNHQSSLAMYDLDTMQLQPQVTIPLPLLVHQEAFLVAMDLPSPTQPALFYFAVVASNKVFIYCHGNNNTTEPSIADEINAPAEENILSAVFFSTPLGMMLVLGTEGGELHFWNMQTHEFCLRCNPDVGPVTTVVVSQLSPCNLFAGGQTGIVSHVKLSGVVNESGKRTTIAVAKVERIESPPDDNEYDAVVSINFVQGCVYCVRDSSYMTQLTPDQCHITAANDVFAMASSPNGQAVVWCSEQYGMMLQEW
ncbi:Hypothetical protein, putative [Bodo saltans]|uniref:WD40 repeat-containing protein n=1 Tax=Bodo saltans TaxID=75058 RepID=A0A0S4KHJ9_BODSA|nr:Hypothetical protein, putative [Bodo saltans]|eukprot:CUI11638.1 Hypothetical protein, putative [Bodo saltans]